MDISTIFKKDIEISSLQESDLMIRRLFILMDGKRTLGDLLKVCRISDSKCKELILSLLEKESISIVESFQKKENLDIIVAEPKKDTTVIEKNKSVNYHMFYSFASMALFGLQNIGLSY